MKEMNITPFYCCGPITFGDSFLEISKKYPDHKEFKKNEFSKFLTSSIMNGNVHVFYSEQGNCVGVEVFPPVQLMYDGINLFGANLKATADLLINKSFIYEVSDSGLDFPDLGVSLYSNDFEESFMCSVDSVYVYFYKKNEEF